MTHYRYVHLHLHPATVLKLQRVRDAIGATTYSEVLRRLLEHWERDTTNIRQISPAEDATN